MNLFRLLLIVLLFYLGFRLLKNLLLGNQSRPKVREGRAKPKPNPFEGADIEDVPYTELPPDESEGKKSS